MYICKNIKQKMKRMSGIGIALGITAVVAVSGAAFLSHPQFGKTARGERLERIHQSPHFQNDKFQNEEETILMTSDRGMASNMAKFLFGKSPTILCRKKAKSKC